MRESQVIRETNKGYIRKKGRLLQCRGVTDIKESKQRKVHVDNKKSKDKLSNKE